MFRSILLILLSIFLFTTNTSAAQNDSISVKLDAANEMALNGNPELAVKLYDEVLAIDENNIEALYFAGLSHLYLKNFQKAIVYFEKTERLRPDFQAVYPHKAAAYMSLKKYDKAVEEYTKAINLSPNDDTLFAQRAIAYLILKQQEKAYIDAKTALQFNPKNEAALEIISLFTKRQ